MAQKSLKHNDEQINNGFRKIVCFSFDLFSQKDGTEYV